MPGASVVSALSDTPVTGTVTVTLHVAVLPPSAVVTVMAAEPPPTAVTVATRPVPAVTVATPVLLLDHETALFAASAGAMVAVSEPVLPAMRLMVVWLRATPVTWTGTVTAHAAVLLPSAVVTVITAGSVLPETAVTVAVRPVPAVTVATLGLLLDHETALFAALLGAIVAVSVSLPPTAIVVADLLSVTPVTGTGTVTEQVFVLLPSSVVTVIVAVPAALAVIVAVRPLPVTAATLLLLLVQVTFLLVASLGAIVAVR
jgi:hypothetical protein